MSKFRIWVDDSNLDKVMGFDQFDTDTQRQVGFTGGTPASSIRVNTALRQANLVACALMNLADTGNTADFRSSVATVQSLLSNYISNTMVAYKATNADINNLNTENNAVVNFKIGNGTAYNKTINNVANVTTSINNQNINTIFESNGTTVKNATIATYASSDTSKGTIEERLTRLGLREGVATFSSDALMNLNESRSYIKLYRQGNYVILKGKLIFLDYNSMLNLFSYQRDFFTLPNEFLPKENAYFFLGSILVANVRTSATNVASTNVPITTLCELNINGLCRTTPSDSINTHLINPTNMKLDYQFYEFSVGYEAVPLN